MNAITFGNQQAFSDVAAVNPGNIVKVTQPGSGFDASQSGGDLFFKVEANSNGRLYGTPVVDIEKASQQDYAPAVTSFEVVA